MGRRIESGDPRTRVISQGRAFTYVLPCDFEAILKVGFSRDPLARMQTLHPRYFEFFDLQRAFLIETERVKDAREIEQRLMRHVTIHHAPAPLVVPARAAGHTEWYRGAYAAMKTFAENYAQEHGFVLHAPLERWLHETLSQRSDVLFEWTLQVWSQLGCMVDERDRNRLRWQLRNALDAYTSVNLGLDYRLPQEVLSWYHENPTS